MALTGTLTIDDLPLYFAQPDAAGRCAVVLVIQEIFGVHPHIQDICRRFADLGYLAIAPDLYARQGDVSGMQDHNEIRDKVVSHVPDSQVMADLDAAVDWAEASGRGDTARLGVTGFCWGGRIAWLYAAHSARLKAAVAWYGRLASAPTTLQPRAPIDIAGELRAPVLGLYGGKDAGIPLDTVEAMRAAIQRAGSVAEIVVYPDAGHGFFADYRPSFNQVAAHDGWHRLLTFFRQHGAA